MLRVSTDVRERWQQARPDLDTSSMEIIGPLKRLHRLLELAMEPVYDGAPVTPAELDVLVRIRHTDESVIARQLARQMNHSRAGISKILARLEERGYVTRCANPSDRRSALVHITPAGVTVVDTMFPQQLASEAAVLAELTPTARQHITEALELLLEAVRSKTPTA